MRLYLFNGFQLEPAARRLRHADVEIAVEPRVLDLLVYLVEHRERAIGRDELIAAVWGRSDGSDAILGQAVLKARKLVGDDGNLQCCIRTVPRFGYQWVAATVAQKLQTAAPLPENAASSVAAVPVAAATAAASAVQPEAPSSQQSVLQREAAQEVASPDERDLPAAANAAAPPLFPGAAGPAPGAVATSVPAVSVPVGLGTTPGLRIGPLVLTVLLLAAVIATLLWLRPREQPAPGVTIAAQPVATMSSAASDAPTATGELILVQPAALASPLAADEWLKLGVLAVLSQSLQGLPGRSVIPAETAMRLAADEGAAAAVQERSGAKIVVSPRLRREGTQWQLDLTVDVAGLREEHLTARGDDAVALAEELGRPSARPARRRGQ